MTRPLSNDLRQRVVGAVAGGMSRRAAAERFGMAASTAAGKPVYWRFNPHFNRHGNVVVAQTLMSRLLESELIDLDPATTSRN